MQFHPEVVPARIRQWEVDGFDPDEVYAQAVADEPVSTPVWRQVAGRFAALATAPGPGERRRSVSGARP
ncbi:hypothetical protein [Nonomuraea salmonea]|uniref:hypothetical protein n=1 Tax=Nonomuraea salmonea TaxID=46181 RepID=UPI0031E7FBD2